MKASQNSRDLQAIISLVVFTAPTVTTLAFIKISCPCAFAFSSVSVWFKPTVESSTVTFLNRGDRLLKNMQFFQIIFCVNGFCLYSQTERWTLEELPKLVLSKLSCAVFLILSLTLLSYLHLFLCEKTY